MTARTTTNTTVGDIKVDAVPVSLMVPGRGVVGRVCESGQAVLGRPPRRVQWPGLGLRRRVGMPEALAASDAAHALLRASADAMINPQVLSRALVIWGSDADCVRRV